MDPLTERDPEQYMITSGDYDKFKSICGKTMVGFV